MGDVAAELAGPGVAEQRVEVGAVDVDLAAVVVDDLAQLGDGVLVDAVRRRVGHHDRRQAVGVGLALGAQVVEVDRAVVGGRHHDDPHAGHHRGRGVGAVGRGRDQADVALSRAVGAVVGADRQQPGELALRPGVGLDRDPVVAGHLGQPLLELADQLAVAGRVLGGRERVQVGEAGQADRLHLGGGVELHRAGAERDHAAVEGVVAGREPAQVAQHLGLAVVAVEHLVGEVRRRAHAGRPAAVVSSSSTSVGSAVTPKARSTALTVEPVVTSEVDSATRSASTSRRCRPRPARGRDDVGGAARDRHGQRVEEGVVLHLDAGGAQRRGEHGRVAVDPGRDRRAARRGRGRRRTSTPRRRAAPGRCRCWRSPCRGGCAARGSAARGGTPAGPRRRRRPRPAGRAGAARARRPTAMKPACGPP